MVLNRVGLVKYFFQDLGHEELKLGVRNGSVFQSKTPHLYRKTVLRRIHPVDNLFIATASHKNVDELLHPRSIVRIGLIVVREIGQLSVEEKCVAASTRMT